jgi:hypothetical protein
MENVETPEAALVGSSAASMKNVQITFLMSLRRVIRGPAHLVVA